MLWLVHKTPQCPLSTNLAMPARMSRAFEGSIEAVGSSSSSSRGRLSIALARLRRVCSPDDSNARLGPPIADEVVNREQPLDPRGEIVDGVEHAEHAQVLLDGEIAGQRRIDGGEVGARQGPAAVDGEVDALDLDPPGARLEDARGSC